LGGSSSGGASSGGFSSSGGGALGATTGHDNGDGPVGQNHGCGCVTAGENASTDGLGGVAAVALGLGLILRRRRS
jgi:MYXO-CTERM domain-containing protein